MRGGELNWFSKQRVPENFAQVVFAQEVNQVGEPFKTDIGWHIVEVTGRQPQRVVNYEEVKDEIYTYLTNEQRKDSVELLLRRLRKAANIMVISENL